MRWALRTGARADQLRLPLALTGPVVGEFVAVALPGIIAKDPLQFFIPSSAIVEN